eukprot:5094741-Prymnesium_polylepis.1
MRRVSASAVRRCLNGAGGQASSTRAREHGTAGADAAAAAGCDRRSRVRTHTKPRVIPHQAACDPTSSRV